MQRVLHSAFGLQLVDWNSCDADKFRVVRAASKGDFIIPRIHIQVRVATGFELCRHWLSPIPSQQLLV